MSRSEDEMCGETEIKEFLSSMRWEKILKSWWMIEVGSGRSFPAEEMDFPVELACVAAKFPSFACKWQKMQGNCRVMNMSHKKLVKHLLPAARHPKHFPSDDKTPLKKIFSGKNFFLFDTRKVNFKLMHIRRPYCEAITHKFILVSCFATKIPHKNSHLVKVFRVTKKYFAARKHKLCDKNSRP